MILAQNGKTFPLLVILLMTLSQIQIGSAKNRRDSSHFLDLKNVTTLGPQSKVPMEIMDDSRLFHWCSVVLDQYYVSVEAMVKAQEEMMAAWNTCHPTAEFNYGDPATLAVYIRSLLPHSIKVMTQIIEETPTLKALFTPGRPRRGDVVNIVSIAGGPGTEMAGVLNYLLLQHRQSLPQPPMLRFLIVDSVAQWQSAIVHLEHAIKEGEESKNGITIMPRFEKSFYQWDLQGNKSTEQVSLPLLPTVLHGDLFILKFVFPTLFCSTESDGSASASVLSKAKQNLEQLFSSAPLGALFLIVDTVVRHEDWLTFLEPSVFSPTNSIKVADNPRHVSILSGDSQSKPYLGKHFGGIPLEPVTPYMVLLYQKTST